MENRCFYLSQCQCRLSIDGIEPTDAPLAWNRRFLTVFFRYVLCSGLCRFHMFHNFLASDMRPSPHSPLIISQPRCQKGNAVFFIHSTCSRVTLTTWNLPPQLPAACVCCPVEDQAALSCSLTFDPSFVLVTEKCVFFSLFFLLFRFMVNRTELNQTVTF